MFGMMFDSMSRIDVIQKFNNSNNFKNSVLYSIIRNLPDNGVNRTRSFFEMQRS